MSLYFGIQGIARALFFTISLSAVPAKIVSEKFHIGLMASLAASYGVGGAVFTLFYEEAFKAELSDFFLFLALVFLAAGLWAGQGRRQ